MICLTISITYFEPRSVSLGPASSDSTLFAESSESLLARTQPRESGGREGVRGCERV